ncbi:MAG TPA: tetratricopeptide repeat protein [Ferruginibacter sp.]|jgi:tetratricopeptide (TPR) repeat protein|nr:tetratricopeptide repeat protein [Ferruginibacter sp.]
MKKIPGLLILFLFLLTGAFAQGNTTELINEGIKFHDKGDYAAAIEQFKKALLADSRSAHANYELSTSYFAMKDYANALKYADIVISLNIDYIDQAYLLKGSVQDVTGKPLDAIKTYNKALKLYPNNHLLYYNLALTSFNLKQYKDADNALEHALKIDPYHASSHFLLALSMLTQEKRAKGILALFNFLLTEPNSKRSPAALQTLEEEMAKETKKAAGKPVARSTQANNEETEFQTAEIMLSLNAASRNNEINRNKTAQQLFIENAQSFFTILGGLKKNKKGFWWNFYVDYFYTLASKGHTEALCYYIIQSKGNAYSEWMQANLSKMESFSEWYTTYLHKH